jgi:hypothetical protein
VAMKTYATTNTATAITAVMVDPLS